MKHHHRRLCSFQPRAGFQLRKQNAFLGGEPEVSFEDGMKATYEWAQEQGLLRK